MDSLRPLCPHCSRMALVEGLHCTYCGCVAPQICGSYAASDITNNLPVIYILERLKQTWRLRGCAVVCCSDSKDTWYLPESGMSLGEEPEVVRVPSVVGLHSVIKLRRTRESKSGIVSSTGRSVLVLNKPQNRTWVSSQRKLLWP